MRGAARSFEVVARNATHIFGGNALHVGGRGDKVEALTIAYKSLAIPGGAEDIMDDFGARSVCNQRVRAKGTALYRHFRSDLVSAEGAALELPPNRAVAQRELITVVWKLVDLNDRGGAG